MIFINILCIDKTLKDAKTQKESSSLQNLRSGPGVYGGLSIKHNDTVGQVSGHDEIVLHNEGSFLSMKDESEKQYRC